MDHTALSPPSYDEDFVLWAQCQIDLIRERQFAQLDIDNLLDELEYLVNKRKRAVRSRLRVLMMHLLKWEYQTALRSNSWIRTICAQRRKIEDELEDSPSLKRLLPSYMEAAYAKAARQAAIETGLPRQTFPELSPYTEQQLLDLDFFP